MVFSSMFFLWAFLPITLCIYFILNQKFKNFFLLVASLFFYAWGEPKYILLMIFSVVINYVFGLMINSYKDEPTKRKILLWVSIILNLGILFYFKYFNFILGNINSLIGQEVLSIKNIILPIGISFYTFQSLSYVVDVYRQDIKPQKNIFNLALYISFFPQLIAGPIVKYHDIEAQLDNRKTDIYQISCGIRRFLYGLGKKVIISNSLALIADNIFGLNHNELNTPLAWLGIICYTLQIYYDFSGYSDMAIGLGKIFGFEFMENFNYPYLSKSIQEFWRRWHISLSTWFREYLYIPLGGNRKGKFNTYRNLLIVFFATGLWHGASWTFIIWGLFHGFFIVIERLFLGRILASNKIKILNHIYTLLVVMIGWVFFRSESLTESLNFIKVMFIPDFSQSIYKLSYFITPYTFVILLVAILCSGLLQLNKKLHKTLHKPEKVYFIESIMLFLILLLCIISLASGTYNPFIYFRF